MLKLRMERLFTFVLLTVKEFEGAVQLRVDGRRFRFGTGNRRSDSRSRGTGHDIKGRKVRVSSSEFQ